MREKILKRIAHWHATYPWRMLAVVLLLTVVFAGFADEGSGGPTRSANEPTARRPVTRERVHEFQASIVERE